MIYKIITTQPSLYDSFLKTGLVARGLQKKIIKIKLFNLYDFADDPHRSIDDTPYGGGAGMVLRVDVMAKALRRVKTKRSKVVLLTPQGQKFDQKNAGRLAQFPEIILVSGRFEGYDERIRELVDEEISVGDFVLTSGDLPAMVLIDAISRQIPGFIEKAESTQNESFSQENLVEYPQYTRPFQFKGKKVPEILLSGNHQKINQWRKEQSEIKTERRKNTRL